MTEFWEETFKNNHELWGFEPSASTVLTSNSFVEYKVKNVLIPGIGYGRNAQIFRDNGMTVTGIEISQTAIDLAYKHFGNDLTIYHGSATEMPYDKKLYDGIYSYALIHFLNKDERKKLIQDCYNQLSDNGYMFFATVSKESKIYGQGVRLDKDTIKIYGGLQMFFYDLESIQEEFGKAGLFETVSVQDIYPFYLIKCRKMKNQQG